MKNDKPKLIGPMTLSEWDQKWVKVEGGLTVPQPQLRRKIGVFRVRLNGRVMFVGKVVEWPGGLAKRLADFDRPSSSGRNHYAGRLIHAHRHDLVVEVLITNTDEHIEAFPGDLKTAMVRLHKPVWNARNAPGLGKV